MAALAEVERSSAPETAYHVRQGGAGQVISIRAFSLWYGRKQALHENTLDIETGVASPR